MLKTMLSTPKTQRIGATLQNENEVRNDAILPCATFSFYVNSLQYYYIIIWYPMYIDIFIYFIHSYTPNT